MASRSSIPSTRRSSRPRSSRRRSSGATRPRASRSGWSCCDSTGKAEVLRFPTAEPRWRPSEADWATIKQRSVERDAEVAIVGVGAGRRRLPPPRPSASARPRTPWRLDLLSRGSAPVHLGGAGPVAHPLAFGSIDSETAAAHRARGPARLRQLPLLLERRQRAGPRRRLRQRQGRLRGPARVEADGAGRQEDHHLERLQERRRRGHLRAALAGLARRPLRDQHGQGPRGVRGDARHLVFAALLPDQGHSRRLRHADRHVQAVAGRRRPRVRAEQPDLEPRRQVDRLRPDEGLQEGRRRQRHVGPAERKGRPRVRQ